MAGPFDGEDHCSYHADPEPHDEMVIIWTVIGLLALAAIAGLVYAL